MARTNEDEVRSIFGASEEGTAMDSGAVNFAIEGANTLVDDRLGTTTDLDADTLRRIEALVACHILTGGDPTEQSFQVGGTAATFEGGDQGWRGLGETRFGRRAILLDTTGTLANEGAPTTDFKAFGP